MRWIEYDYVCNEKLGIILHKKVEYNEANLAIAQAEACNGEYTITEDEEVIEVMPVAIEFGGTNAKTAEEACKNVGGINTYVQSESGLTGIGSNGKFKAIASSTISSIDVNGVQHSVRCGAETSMELVAGCWYTFILDGDTVNFNAGGAGGGSSDFIIVSGMTRPAKPTQNTLWVQTSDEITSIVFAAAEPANPIEGMLWLSVVDTDGVKITAPVGGEWIVILLDSTKQYINGEWVLKGSMGYRDGVWEELTFEWNGELYMSGVWYVESTGNWVSLGKAIGSDSYDGRAPDIQDNEDNFKIYYAANVEGSGMYYLEDKIDLTNYTTLHFEGELNPYDGVETRARVQIWSDIGQYTLTNVVAYLAKSGLNNGVGSIDVSALNGEYHIGFNLYSRANNASTIICEKLYLT